MRKPNYHFNHRVLACVAIYALLQSASSSVAANPVPNVILMMADDMGMGDTSAYQDYTGNSDTEQILTPNMERLARMGVRFTDAHTPASRCTLTRYALLTGRYSWRNRMKHFVLFGVQGDPLIERDRPTLGTLCQSQGYRTALVGKWHVGLRYRQSDGSPADAWEDADLTQPMFDTPLDHGFDYCRFTSRSHGTSGPAIGGKKVRNDAQQSVGPGHIHGRTIVGATGDGKKLVDDGPHAYVLKELGSRHLSNAKSFLEEHLSKHREKPFFLYYPCSSNHGPHTPATEIEGIAVAGASTNVAGNSLNVRSDFIYENDVVLGRLLDYLQTTEDPRNGGHKLIENTIVVFTSDNGAEVKNKSATGPFRSNKGSVYEGGHRVPFVVSWPAGRVGDGDDTTEGESNDTLIGLQDMFSTLTEIIGAEQPDFTAGEKGGEDSQSILAAWRGERIGQRIMFFNDHKEAKDHAVLAFREDDPVVNQTIVSGKWKLFLDADLLRSGVAVPVELFDLETDPKESTNRLDETNLSGLVSHLTQRAINHRTSGGHHLAARVHGKRKRLMWTTPRSGQSVDSIEEVDLTDMATRASNGSCTVLLNKALKSELKMTVKAVMNTGKPASTFDVNQRGLGIVGGDVKQVDNGESIIVEFDRDVLIESLELIAGNGVCGGSYQKGTEAPLAIYCVDADIDFNDQSGILSDIGVLRKGQPLKINSAPHYGVEAKGQWRLGSLTLRTLNN